MANEKKTRGLTVEQELNEEFLFRDTRTTVKKFVDWITVPDNMVVLLGLFATAAFLVPALALFLFVVAFGFFRWGMKREETAPLKMPIQSKFLDPHQPHPATGAPTEGKGIFFLGNEMKTGKEVWLTNDDARQHFLVVGTTGAGKTESLLGFAANALTWGSGFLFCDGKGDVALFAKVYALARRFGREDDLLVLNFMTGNQDLGASGGKIMSNTLNPFSTGSSDSLTQMVVSLMDDAGGDGAMWKGRATAMLTGVMRALTWLRDEGRVDLNVGEIRSFMSLRKIIDLGDETGDYKDIPQPIRKSITSYLTSLPGFTPEKGHKQAQTTLDQHGYLEMQFTKILGSLADVYGHIFKTPYGEVDMFDVVLNRRILVIMLPALEKSGDEIANLGKIVVATLKGMMGATLGSQLEGTWAQVVENRPTNSPSPFICVLDEVGYYTVEGMALMAAQARSLGFSMCYASQDIPAMKRLNEKEAASIIANTNTKIFMRSEEADVTGKLAVDTAGKGMRAQVGGFSGETGDMGTSYRDTKEARLEAADRVNFTDLKAQTEGMMHVLFQDKVVRAKSFYANPEGAVDNKKLSLRANHFIKVPKPDVDDLERARKMPKIIEKMFSEETVEQLKKDAQDAVDSISDREDDIAISIKAFDHMRAAKRKPVECAGGAVAAVIHDMRSAVSSFHEKVKAVTGTNEDSSDNEDQLPGFGKRPVTPLNDDIDHRVRIEGDDDDDYTDIDMADDFASNDSIMRALAALDHEPGKSKEDVDSDLMSALDPSEFMDADDSSDPDPDDSLISDMEGALDKASGGLFDDLDGVTDEKPKDKAPLKTSKKEDDDEGSGEPQNVTTQLLSEFFMDDDDDE
ncbi:TraM recognition domain-containing protein [Sulfitobacter sp. R18_1]|uniref:TraM recognition domain-containing protein n=1 Tax=Sulfitobacter sp. R18_1 TaxID=2821104 RepID=UPI001ADCF049|nr:TraM recognition domain-containing protein [Sulfitobacter sp. R18_1]MBO9428434.1 TraM recognition domain-containing protein [Sulfitobacter sp. R18_1]